MDKISAAEITEFIKRQLEDFEAEIDFAETGVVVEDGDGIARVYGLEQCMANELLEFPGGVYGVALNLEEDNVGVVILGDYLKVKEGQQVKRTGRILSVPVGEALIGRVVNALGEPIDGKGPIDAEEYFPIERLAPGVVDRRPVHEPLQTGIKAIDAMIPIGRGQRELIIGDRQTGKTAIAIDTILNQKDTDVICIYVAIGQKQSTVARIVKTLEEYGAMEYTVVVQASASEPAPLLYIAGLEARTAAATSSVAVTFSGVSSFVSHMATTAHPRWGVWIGCAVGVFLGSQLGSRFMASRLKGKNLKRVFAAVLLLVAAVLFFKDVL